MNMTFHEAPCIDEDIIRITYREYRLTLYVKSLCRSISVTDFKKMLQIIDWSLPDDEDLLDVADQLIVSIDESGRSDRIKASMHRWLNETLWDRGLFYARP